MYVGLKDLILLNVHITQMMYRVNAIPLNPSGIFTEMENTPKIHMGT